MAVEVPLFTPGVFVAAADLSTKQFYFVFQTAVAFNVNVPTADGQFAFGVLQNKPISGEAATVECGLGAITKMVLGGTVAPGDFVGSDASGRAIAKQPSFSGADLSDWILGQCLEGGAVGEIGTIRLGPMFIVEHA